MILILAASSSLPRIPANWPGWLILFGLAVALAAGVRRWFKS